MTSDWEIDIAAVRLAPGNTLEDNWYAIKPLDEDTVAIGEPAYHQRNWTYLINGERDKQSLLFDTGSGRRPIAPLIARHATAPVTALPSHMHFDHLGGVCAFDRILVADLSILRAQSKGGRLTPSRCMHIGYLEHVEPPSFTVSEWISPNSILEMGNRRLKVLHTPGHSPDSVALWEEDRNRLYAGDFVYCGALYAQTPGASLPAYLETTEFLLDLLPVDADIVCAHGRPIKGVQDVPRLTPRDLLDLRAALKSILKRPAPYAGEVTVNQQVSIRFSESSFG